MKKIVVFLFFTLLLVSCSSSIVESNEELIEELPVSGNKEDHVAGLSRNVVKSVVTDNPSMCLVGDSRVALWPDGYFTGWDVHNIGVGSTTSYDAAYAIYYQTQHFDTLIISTGVNDVAVKASLQESLIALSACIAQAKLKADNVYITTIPGTTPTFGGAAEASFLVSYRAAQINSYLPTIAASHGVGLIHLAYLLNNGIYLKAEYDDGSGIHYNKAAYDVMESLYNRAMGLE